MRVLAVITALFVALVATAQVSYDETAAKAQRFFDHREWASASACYNYMIGVRPDDCDLYSRAIVANNMMGDTVSSARLLTDAMAYKVPVDSLLAHVMKYSFEVGNGGMYESFLKQVAAAYPWFSRPVDAYLLRYYTFRNNGAMMVAYAKKMLVGAENNTSFLLILAKGYMLENRVGEAVDTWRRILEIDPENTDALLWLGNYYRLGGDTATADSYLSRVKK